MSKIRVLDDSTINKIAAGEVVERPYSIVKELVENSVDALSTNITVEIKNGGKSYIRVTDNGSGIESGDIRAAFLRHSTSKISQVEDLQNIVTLGFRGEALASIASVSQLEVISKTRDSEIGQRLLLYSGEVKEESEVGAANGTTIIVRNLFYNIPVRKKFLKSDSSESGAISDLIYRLSLSNPSISFKFIKDGALVLKTPGKGSLEKTAYSLLGKEFSDSTIPLEFEKKSFKLSGFISKPAFSRGNRSQQYIFVNGRSVKHLLLSRKVESAYKGVIPSNRYPVLVLFIELDPREIDVNIHPAKTEIRFLAESEILIWVEEAVRKALDSETEILETSLGEVEPPKAVKPRAVKLLEKREETQPSLLDPELFYQAHSEKPEKLLEKPLKAKKSNEAVSESGPAPYRAKPSPKQEQAKLPTLEVKGVVFNTYILCEDRVAGEFLIIDQHAAHERIMYEKLKRELLEGRVDMQETMALEPISLSHSDMEKLSEYRDTLLKLGFDFEEFGQNTVALRGVPLLFGVPDFKDLFLDILDSLEFGVKSGYELKLEKVMKLACTSAVKAGDSMKHIEIEKLIEELGRCENPLTCPHGRPTVIKLTKSEIERKFKRS
ncbi:DNA mismatch repair protein MutL [Andreesenia angusta]|uniref:DNA mismatch repair protein MutL n=1 Tax=Andreesenia angusta TaxID=39480 RepID=A0A1S1V9Q1_9FIRM|nr:DNA mismatch repair endonuclease MutL [Andreesenia angusta]OHW62857.1 DNA mismatch repair protein MutL [Andreesenia angusta]